MPADISLENGMTFCNDATCFPIHDNLVGFCSGVVDDLGTVVDETDRYLASKKVVDYCRPCHQKWLEIDAACEGLYDDEDAMCKSEACRGQMEWDVPWRRVWEMEYGSDPLMGMCATDADVQGRFASGEAFATFLEGCAASRHKDTPCGLQYTEIGETACTAVPYNYKEVLI